MKQGYGVFGKAYEVMLRSDLHAPGSIDHQLMERMILLEEDSLPLLYGGVPAVNPAMKEHALYPFTRQFVGKSAVETIDNLLRLTAGIAQSCDLPFEQMRFGGTEQQILQRGTDWCADLARVGVALLNCAGIPARIGHLVNPDRPYNGHVVVEAHYDGRFGALDFVYGSRFGAAAPLSLWELHRSP